MADLWRYKTGQKGVNRVTVFERKPGGPLHVEWWDNEGRHRETLTNASGHPITDRDLAQKIARSMSDAQRAKRNAQAAHALLGQATPRTLGELLARLHERREAKWSSKYRKDQKRFRRFWLRSLGAGTYLRDVTAGRVEDVANRAKKANDWSDRTQQAYLRYIVDAFTFAQVKEKWITEQHNLSAVEFPTVRGQSLPYTDAEMQAMRKAAPKVGVREAAFYEIARGTGRRSTAIRTLRMDAIEDRGEFVIVQFPGATDKARRAGQAVLVGAGAKRVRTLLEQPAVQATGYLFPYGALDSSDKDRKPMGENPTAEMIHAIEEEAGVKHVKGRAAHGIKRWFATKAKDRRAASKQSGTSEQTLRGTYEQDWLDEKVELAKKLDRAG